MVVLVNVLVLSNEHFLVLRLRPNGGEALGEEVLRHFGGDLNADLLNFFQARIDATFGQFLGGHLVGQRSCGHQKGFLRYGVHRAGHHRQRDARENVRVIAFLEERWFDTLEGGLIEKERVVKAVIIIITLARYEGLVLVLENVEWRAGSKNAFAVRIHIGLFSCALGLRGRIGERKDERRLVVLRHFTQHAGREHGRLCTDADQTGRLNDVHDLLEVLIVWQLLCVEHLVLVRLIFAILAHQTLRVDQKDVVSRLLSGQTVRLHGHHQ